MEDAARRPGRGPTPPGGPRRYDPALSDWPSGGGRGGRGGERGGGEDSGLVHGFALEEVSIDLITL